MGDNSEPRIGESAHWSARPLGAFNINWGEADFALAAHDAETLEAGLKLALVLDGDLTVRALDGAPTRLKGASLCLFFGRESWRLEHQYAAGRTLRYVTLNLGADLLEQEALALGTSLAGASGAGPVSAFISAPPLSIAAIGEQILSCPMRGAARDLYLGGKGLELTAMALNHFIRGEARAASAALGAAELRRVVQAREMMDAAPGQAPSLPELARSAGLNVRKLTSGFRALYGMSVAEYLRERRMVEAWRSLSSGACDVTRAAEDAGYALPHFSAAFLRRFGVLPSAVRNRSAI
ncbi:helix-turn-helix transcriptional regulator [Brevundimonas sp. SL130]|uniref:helix-turn-helix transcriptional regulator n=1 Tax=Brevundimonas sp. SL130 TaxID=2995143 RepID=UPI00226D1509|nr:AraC family transcriptional regulator [Brevundimonas sp. SL130]WAC61338.1 AraC family transcriptional regulator [Brevundimonas sp. SL130]